MTDAAIQRHRVAESRIAKQIEHPPVVAQHVGVEGLDTVPACRSSKLLEQPRADAVALQRVSDGEGDLRAA